MTEEEVDMVILLLNRNLKSDISNQNCWNILNGDEGNILISNNIDRVKTLLEGLDLGTIPPIASTFFGRMKQIGQSFQEYFDSLTGLNPKLLRAINIKNK